MGDKLFTTHVNKYGAFDDYYDFKFWVNGNEFRVHRLVFASHSNFFVRLFKAHPKEFVIDDVSEQTFEEVVKFIYSEDVELTYANENKLLAAARRFEIKGLMQRVQMFRNLRNDPLAEKELDNLRLKYVEAKYMYDKAKERHSARNPFNQPPSRYY